ncbi:MAG: diaminopimelate epimerase [Chloroflexi bacterium]|nr:diaminopimelate epimerase [Chloroflexota bacterium]
MRFTKMQGTGNDFVVIEPENVSRNWPRLAIAMCDRHYGIGADGLLVMLPSTKADFAWRIFNADGSESETCGNGLRCSAKYFVDRGIARPGQKEIAIETISGIRKVVITKKGDKVVRVKVGMGDPKFRAEDVPVVPRRNQGKIKQMITCPMIIDGKELRLNLISMGNPHAVFFYRGDVDKFPLASIGPKVEHHKLFPARVNFEVVRVLGNGRIESRTWERGVGETLACGSGACATAVAAKLRGYIKERAEIRLRGGVVDIEWDGKGEVFLSGPAETVFTGEWVDSDPD